MILLFNIAGIEYHSSPRVASSNMRPGCPAVRG
jgi:hypothetical protein